MTALRDQLIDLLPRVYHQRDTEPGQGGVLEALLQILGEQGDLVAADLEQLYDDAFIETCADWVVPYLGDLLGVRLLHPLGPGAGRQRALVANTLDHRRRKGTLAALEDLAFQVTGWPTAAVEYFQRLGTTQHLAHRRPGNLRTPDLRRAADLELVGGPFSVAARTAEARLVPAGLHNLPTIGLHVWRLAPQTVLRATARPVTDPPDGRYLVDPVGLAAPLFNAPPPQPSITTLAREFEVPAPLRTRALYDELEGLRAATGDVPRWFGAEPVIEVYADTGGGLEAVPVAALTAADLGDPPAATSTGWPRPAAPLTVAVDPVRGRLAFRDGLVPTAVEVTATVASPGRVGAGSYVRDTVLPTAPDGSAPWFRAVGAAAAPVPGAVCATIAEAVADWQAEPAGTIGVIALLDSRTYVEDLAVTVPAGSELTIAALAWSQAETANALTVLQLTDAVPAGRRPHLRGSITVTGTAPTGDELPGELAVDGLLLEGSVTVAAGDLGRLALRHTTLVPGTGSLTVDAPAATDDDNGHLVIELTRAISGPVAVPHRGPELDLATSIVDGVGGPAVDAPRAPALLDQVTVVGALTVEQLSASDCVLAGQVTVERHQAGCLRFSYLSEGAVAPRRFRCQPDLALTGVTDAATAAAVRARLTPAFSSTTYGDPAYGRLDDRSDPALLTGASNGAAMGAFAELQEPQRLANLAAVLDEHLRLGLEAGVVRET
ncbi:hypothetical protein [Nocardioides taihuensis]|uniref:Phage tail protein (Tail_P2_I) n=1 Tax=Nocardioides taihuensis TaxID=1835606 RepID=A0ABW0BDQ5_9ACTN